MGIAFVESIRLNGNCGGNGEGITDLNAGLEVAIDELMRNGDDESVKKIVAINNCKDTTDQLCGDENIEGLLKENRIELWMVNILGGSASNALKSGSADSYKLCLTDDDADRICVSPSIDKDE